MSDQLTRILERAVEQAPASHLTGEDALVAGRARVRRRRAVGMGSVVGAAALVVVVWLGLGGGSVLGTPEVTPASVTWEPEEGQTVVLVDRVAPPEDAVAADGLYLGSLAVTRSAEGVVATAIINGAEQRLVGSETSFGAQLFAGPDVSVLVWDQPDDADGVTLVPEVEGFAEITRSEHDDVWYAVMVEPVEPVQDLVFHDEQAVWTASGEVAETSVVADERGEQQVFWLDRLGLAGVVGEGLTLLEPEGALIGEDQLPWWRGGATYDWVLARLPEEATLARLISAAPGRHLDGDPVVDTVPLGDSAYALVSRAPSEPGEGSQYAPDLQWSSGDGEWHDREGRMTDIVGLAGLDLDGVGDRLRASRSGTVLEELPEMGQGLWAWQDGDAVVVAAEVGEMHPTADLVPVVAYPALTPVLGNRAVSAAPHLVTERSAVEVDGRELQAIRVAPSDEGGQVVGALLVNSLVLDETVQVLGGSDFSPGLQVGDDVRVSAAERVSLWAAYRHADRPLIIDGPALIAVEVGEGRWDLLARLPDDATGAMPVPVDDSVTVSAELNHVTTVRGVHWWTLPLQIPSGQEPRELLDGLDVDGDGVTDLPLGASMPAD